MLSTLARTRGTTRAPAAVTARLLAGNRMRASTSGAAAPSEAVGLGCCSEEINGVSRATLFRIMMNKIDAPDRFLPVSSVFVRPAEGDAGDDGALWRSMKYHGAGPLSGVTIVEHIYANPAAGEIRFVGLGDDGRETDLEVVNALLTKPLRIEYYQRDRTTRARVPWDAPRDSAMRAIEITIAMAQAKEIHLCDSNYVGSKA